MTDINPAQISVDPYTSPLFSEKGIDAAVLRLDQLHPVISGNKWFKLRFYIEEARRLKKDRLVTYGGPWSNHLHATAAAGQLYGLKTTGIIRGERPPQLSDTLHQVMEMGMQLYFISREDYKNDFIPDTINLSTAMLIPEGGAGPIGVKGAATITTFFNPAAYTHVCCAVGSGTMMAGLLHNLKSGVKLIGISAMKNNHSLAAEVASLTGSNEALPEIIHDYHFGGFAKHTAGLLAFMNEVYQHSGIPTDIVYTGKLFYAVNDLARKNYFLPGSKILLIHSGGLQGNRSLPNGSLIF
jgi:1-aminocyclopropane-1-carboxylate deaminase